MSARTSELTTESRELAVPELSLVVLIGATGSGKSTFAARHFGPYEVLSSDFCRGLVSDDENDQSATNAAFEVLHFIAGKRLEAGRLTVVDATNVQRDARKQLVELARDHDVLPVAIVLDVPESVCLRRNADRAERSFGADVVRRQHDQLRRSLRGLKREGFRTVHVLRGVEEVENARVARQKLLNDFRHETGPFDVIGDVHGCRSELEALLAKLGYSLIRDGRGRAVDAAHPDGRKAIFVGDLVDRGPDSPGVLRLVMGMVDAGHAKAVPGNHEAKLVRALQGRKVRHSHGLAETLEQLEAEDAEFRARVERFCDGLVSHLVLDGGRLVVAHAGLKEAYHGRASGRVRSFALYGDTTGETDEFGLPVRYPWANDYRGSAMVLYGHTPTPEPEWVNNTLCLDTGCVFGGRLTALRYPEREVVSVSAEKVWYEPAKPFPVDSKRSGDRDDVRSGGQGDVRSGDPTDVAPPASSPDRRNRPAAAPDAERPPSAGAVRRDPDVLDLTDVAGKRVVQTAHHGRVTVREENTAAALEVMSRYALDPRWLPYLPPTMAPCATSQRPDLLEHPDEAFDAYRRDGVTRLVCQEKHMGSRAVAVVCRDGAAAERHFHAGDGATGAVYTRTGRSFFGTELTEQLLARLRAAVATAGLWDELGADWLVLDCELLPWSAKAADLLRDQYAATGAAARSGLGAAVAALEQGAQIEDPRIAV
ncbi:MAG: polynucleotide kinase-phosphatase, partial [Jiangellaceae bacterium]